MFYFVLFCFVLFYVYPYKNIPVLSLLLLPVQPISQEEGEEYGHIHVHRQYHKMILIVLLRLRLPGERRRRGEERRGERKEERGERREERREKGEGKREKGKGRGKREEGREGKENGD